jgi:hypothetical protein
MASSEGNHFSGPVTVFRERRLPETATPAGYSALIDAYGLEVPLPRMLSATGAHHRLREQSGWRIMTPRHAPEPTLRGHLTFALKYEGLDLAVLKRLFLATGAAPVEAMVQDQPTGSYARRVWFLYEWLTGNELSLPDAKTGRYVPVLDPSLQWGIRGETAPRYRLHDNLPGTPEFCPLVYRTDTLEELIALDLPQRAKDIVADVRRDVLARAAAFLLLKDSQSSYAIEGESPPQDRMQRWGRAIGEAGRQPLDDAELLRLQRMVIGDDRFVTLGFRADGGFVGEHERESRLPVPDHISARPEDVPRLIDGLLAFDRGPARQLDPVIAAAVLAFGFVYVHPFEDGNGRLHRYLIHHVLAERGYNPPGVVFPVSAAILEQIDRYRETLESYSKRLLPLIRWEPTETFNVRVLNETKDFYRFFDATPHAEFLYDCVRRTIEHHLPAETRFLRRYDEYRRRVEDLVDMPERTIDLLFRFLRQNGGTLSRRARDKEFAALADEEVRKIETIYHEAFAGPTADPAGPGPEDDRA